MLPILLALLSAQESIPLPTAVPVPAVVEGPVVYDASKGPILLPTECGKLDLESLGLVCDENEPCPTFLEISSAETNNLGYLMAGNLHTTTTTLQSILLASEDGGATWREAHPRLKASSLEGMQFLDFSNGWIAGHTSLALPRDPFFLLTTDGGRTWRKSDLYAETRVGVIEDFAFQAAKKGWALIDNRGSGEAGRYELFETQTGGTGWDLRAISSRIPKEAAPGQRAVSQTTRVRADQKKNTITLEVRNGAAWRPVASFRLKLEDCKPDPPAQ